MGEENIETSLLLVLPKLLSYLEGTSNDCGTLTPKGKEEVEELLKEGYRIVSKIYENKHLEF